MQEDGFSIYLPNYISTTTVIFGCDQGYFEVEYENVFDMYIENKCLGRATGNLKNGLCNLNRLTIEKYPDVV